VSVHSLIRFVVKPGREAEFEAALEAAGMLTRPAAVEGFIGADLLRGEGAPTEYYVIGRWRSPEAYARWQEISVAGAGGDPATALFDSLHDVAPGRLLTAVATSPAHAE
jgi:heme-degrading monooxygenase HmoA